MVTDTLYNVKLWWPHQYSCWYQTIVWPPRPALTRHVLSLRLRVNVDSPLPGGHTVNHNPIVDIVEYALTHSR